MADILPLRPLVTDPPADGVPCLVCGGDCPPTTCRRLPWWPWTDCDGRPHVPAAEAERIAADLLPPAVWAGEVRS